MTKVKTSVCVILFFTCANCFSDNNKFKVLQINAWHGTTSVPKGFKGMVNIIKQTDPDVVLLCEINGNGINILKKLVDTLKIMGTTYYGATNGGSAGIISKYDLINTGPCCYSDVQGAMTKIHISIRGQTVAIYSAHLDYTHYACYLPRGYSGTTWKKIDSPVFDADSVLKANRLSQRDETIIDFIENAMNEINEGNLVLLGGDFNEPSYLDWQSDTRNMRGHNGIVVNWDCSVMLNKMGMIDSFRKLFSDAVKHPGFTFPSANNSVAVEKLTWAPDIDERDRIDFIYYYPNPGWILKSVSLVGPEETIKKGKINRNTSEDTFIVPSDVWPTDHKANLAVFEINDKD